MAVYRLGIPRVVYMNEIRTLTWKEGTHGIAKSVVFAGIIVMVSCYKGFTCEGGAEGVGKATTSAVVISMVLILVLDYFFSAIFSGVWHRHDALHRSNLPTDNHPSPPPITTTDRSRA